MIQLASEAVNMSAMLEIGVILSSLVLAISTVGLWYATAQVHKDEVNKLTGELGHANDNMTEVALAEIDSHHEKVQKIRQIQHRKHR